MQEFISMTGERRLLEEKFPARKYTGLTNSDGYLPLYFSPAPERVLGVSVEIKESSYDDRYGTKFTAVPYYNASGEFKGIYVEGDLGPAASIQVTGYIYSFDPGW